MDLSTPSAPDKIYHAHDRFFKRSMENKQVAMEFIQAHVPKEVLEHLDLTHLELQPGSYVDKRHQERIIDILYQTKIAGEPAYIYLLINHQSTPDKLMPFWVLQYLCNVIDKHLRQTNHEGKLPMILPLVIYHGKQQWNYSRDINDLVEGPRDIIDQHFLKPFTLIDLTQIQDETLKERTHWGVMALTMKHIFLDMMPYLLDLLDLLKHVEPSRNGQQFVESVLLYIFDRGELDKDWFVQQVKAQLSPEVVENMMTVAEQFRAEGIQQGVQQGLEQGIQQEKILTAKKLLAEKVDPLFIARITNLPMEKIKELQE